MCDMYGHGFYWRENQKYVFMIDYEINSHSEIKSKRPNLIPAEAISCGFDPVDGSPVGKNGEKLPVEVQEKIHFIMETDFPDRDSIKDWIRHNYAKNNDKDNWDYRLLLLLSDKGKDLFSAQYYTKQAQYCTKQAQYYTKRAQDYTKRAQDYTEWAQYYTKWAQDYTGELDEMDLEKLLEYFEAHPNEYWSQRNNVRQVEKKEYVLI